MVISSCGEEETTVTPIFTEKPVFIENYEVATAKVLEFLNHTDVGEITLRSNFPDTEVNEGLWTLEAASNYVDNVNIAQKSETTIEYTLTINNIVDGDILKMSGADMVSKFNELQAYIDAEETTNEKTAKIVDFKLNNVTAQKSDLTIGVIYAGSSNVDGCEDWPAMEYIFDAGETLEDCLVAAISAQNSNYVWYQSVNLVWPSSCLFGGYVYTTEDGYMTPDKFDEAYSNALEVVSCLYEETFPSSDEATSHYGGIPTWIDISLLGDKLLCCETGIIHCEEIVFGYGIAY